MALSNIITKPLLRGTIATTGPWQALFARAGYRVYPFPPGALVRANTGGVTNTVDTHGLGSFEVGDYVLACRPTFYGEESLYIPQPTLISRISALGTTEDEITIDDQLNLFQGDYFVNLGPDTATPSPTATPNYDGSNITIFSDNVGTNSTGLDYMSTSRGGVFRGWITTGFQVLDLLITDPSGNLQIAIPFVSPGPEVHSA